MSTQRVSLPVYSASYNQVEFPRQDNKTIQLTDSSSTITMRVFDDKNNIIAVMMDATQAQLLSQTIATLLKGMKSR